MPYLDRELQREYQRNWVRANREAWLKKNGPCRICGSSEELEVDHIDPKQKVSHNIWSWSEARRIEELNKCQVLCSACHQKKTSQHRLPPLIHGLYATYHTLKCRCTLCRRANADRKANQPSTILRGRAGIGRQPSLRSLGS